jgi:hypothetical protein
VKRESVVAMHGARHCEERKRRSYPEACAKVVARPGLLRCARNDDVFSRRGRVRALVTTAQQQSFAVPRLLAFLPGRVGLARRPWRRGGVRLAERLPAGLAANVLLLARTAGPPGLVGPLPVALARLPTLDRLPLPGRVRSRKPLQHAAVAQRFLRRDLERDRRETAAGSGAERKCARPLRKNAEPRALPVEHFDPPHMAVSIGVELILGSPVVPASGTSTTPVVPRIPIVAIGVAIFMSPVLATLLARKAAVPRATVNKAALPLPPC